MSQFVPTLCRSSMVSSLGWGTEHDSFACEPNGFCLEGHDSIELVAVDLSGDVPDPRGYIVQEVHVT